MAAVAATGHQAFGQYAPGETVSTLLPNGGTLNWGNPISWDTGIPFNTNILPGYGLGSLSYVARVDFDPNAPQQTLTLTDSPYIDVLDVQSGVLNLNLAGSSMNIVYAFNGADGTFGQSSVYVGNSNALSNPGIPSPTGYLTVQGGGTVSSGDVSVGNNGVDGYFQLFGTGTVWNTFWGLDNNLNPGAAGYPGVNANDVNQGNLLLGTGGNGIMQVSNGAVFHMHLGPSNTPDPSNPGQFFTPHPFAESGGTIGLSTPTNSSITVLNGGQFINDGTFYMGIGGGFGTQVDVSGAGSRFEDHGGLYIGYGASSPTNIVVDGGATLDTTPLSGAPNSAASIGQFSDGTVTVGSFANGAGTWNAGDIFMGAGGNGTLTIENGSTVNAGNLQMGLIPGASGTVYVNDSSVLSTFDTTIGSGGSGDINVNTGGQFYVLDSGGPRNLVIGGSALGGGFGSWTVNSGNGYLTVNDNSTVTVNGGITVGYGGSGYINVNTGPDGAPSFEGLGSLYLGETSLFPVYDNMNNLIGSPSASGYGEVNLAQGTTMSITGQTIVGDSAVGALNIDDARFNAYGTFIEGGSATYQAVGGPITFAGNGTVNITGDGVTQAVLDATGQTVIVGNSSGESVENFLNVTGASKTTDAVLNADSLLIANAPDLGSGGALGNVSVSKGMLNIASLIDVGVTGTGSLYLTNGSVAGNFGGGSANVIVADSGTGTVYVQTGSSLAGNNLTVANNPNSSGFLFVGDTAGVYLGSFIDFNNSVFGNMGTGNVQIEDGFMLGNTLTVGGSNWINDTSTANGQPKGVQGTSTFNMSGGLPSSFYSLEIFGNVTVGDGGVGYVNQLDDGDGGGASWATVGSLTIGRTAEFQALDYNMVQSVIDNVGQGTWTLSNGSRLDVTGATGGLVVGGSAQGELGIDNSTVNVSGPAGIRGYALVGSGEYLPYSNTSAYGNGTINMHGANANPTRLNVIDGLLLVGQYGNGTLNATSQDTNGGAIVDVGQAVVGQWSGATGAINLNAASMYADGGTLTGNDGSIAIGSEGDGHLSATNGSYIHTGSLVVGEFAGSNPTGANLALDNSTLVAADSITFGRGGFADGSLTNGSMMTTQLLAMGTYDASNPAFVGSGTLTAIGSTINVGANGSASVAYAAIGRQGSGTLTLTSGSNMQVGMFSINSAADQVDMFIADQTGGSGQVNVVDARTGSSDVAAQSGLSLWAGNLYVGAGGNGALNVQNSYVNVEGQNSGGALVGGNLYVGGSAGSSGNVTLRGTGSLFASGIASNGGPGQGTVDMEDSNTWVLASEGFFNQTNGHLKGRGTLYVGGAGLINDGKIEPGGSPGVLTVNGNYTNMKDGELDILIDGTTLGTQYSQLSVTGTANLDGLLNITLGPNYKYAGGQIFDLMLYSSNTGVFANDLINGAPINPKLYTLTYESNMLVLSTKAVPEPNAFVACGMGLAGLAFFRRRKAAA